MTMTATIRLLCAGARQQHEDRRQPVPPRSGCMAWLRASSPAQAGLVLISNSRNAYRLLHTCSSDVAYMGLDV
jgi:hypothetical protein